ncbi:Zn-dependent protease with chaperone function [Simiduia aestuariiviva]|uniref:Zn-dependent protease with chaperone function n=1 Tax=Simiduia aestuariiviva TaxID=1510459 RepID=A0A839UQS4_9GAMM|nr:Zn-dependent protease with chaperone function [Simiduia aestuariiviva]
MEFDTLTTLDERIGSPAMRIIHKLENHLGLVVIATVTVLLMGFSYFYWGIPYASKVIAYTLPQGTLQQASDDTLLVMQKRYLQPTKLSAETQARLREKISDFAPDYPIDKLYFYASDSMGANAFALPDGTIVFTDEIIALTEGNDDEVLAVFGHEIGHIEGRHALRQILQSSAIAVTIAMIGGDVSAMGDIVLTLPVVFSQLAFSRKFEIEADQHSRAMLESNGLKSDAFASILTKLYNSHSQCEDSKIKCEKRKDWYRYLSTHPHLEQRLQAISQ